MQHTWAGRRVLVVEDNAIVAMPLVAYFEDCGASVIGPVTTLSAAFAALADAGQIDGAVLDVELGSEMVWPLALALGERDIPFVFATGSAGDNIYPKALRRYPRFAKPYCEDAVAESLHAMMSDATAEAGGLVPAE